MNNIKIDFVKEFTDAPGAEYKRQGKFSGEEFYEKLLAPRYKEAVKNNVKLEIDFDGAYGYHFTFIRGAFCPLSKTFGKECVDNLIFLPSDDTELIEEIKDYIREA